MNKGGTISWVGLAAGLVVMGHAVAQTRLAVTPPSNDSDMLGAAVTTITMPSGFDVPQPEAAPALMAAARDAQAGPEPRGNPLWAIPLGKLKSTHERPLFSPSRRPPAPPIARVEPPPPVAKPAEPERPQFSLIGVVVGRAERIAVFLDETTKEVVRLQKNEDHGGWTLRDVKRREATFQKDRWTVVLAIPAPGANDQSPADPNSLLARANSQR
jgi:general secretion pathway protein N